MASCVIWTGLAAEAVNECRFINIFPLRGELNVFCNNLAGPFRGKTQQKPKKWYKFEIVFKKGRFNDKVNAGSWGVMVIQESGDF